MKWRFLLLLTLIIASASLISAAEDERTLVVDLYENGKITNYLNTYWVVQVNGTGYISNPSDQDLYDVRLFFDILNLEMIDLGGDGTFDSQSLFFDRIPSKGSNSFSYRIVGITAEPPTLTGKGVLYTGLSKRTTRIYSDVFGELQKAPLEDPAVTNRNARLVSVTLSNPTSFQFTIESLKVIKTPELNPNTILKTWNVVNDSTPRVLNPDGFFIHDILDKDAHEGEVYWLHSDVFISRVKLVDNNSVLRYTEKNLTVPIETLNFSNFTNASREFIIDEYGLRKQLSDSVIIPGQPVTVRLLIYNFGSRLAKYTLEDSLPAGFTANTDLRWTGDVPARNTAVVEYEVVLNDSGTAGFDVFPSAKARIADKTVRSPEVTYVRQFLPDDQVYVQKRVTFRDDGKAAVSISVQNFGTNALEGARLKEFLTENDLFSEITVIPESKGVWAVPTIRPNEEWTVTYTTEPGDSLTRLPALFGTPSHSVLRSIVLENIVNEAWEFVRTNTIEILGILVVLLVPTGLLVGRRLNWF